MKKFCDIQSRNELADYLGIPRSKLTHILYVKKPDSYYTTLGLARPAGSPRFECQSKNIHDKITRKVNNVFLAGRRYFPLLRVSFP